MALLKGREEGMYSLEHCKAPRGASISLCLHLSICTCFEMFTRLFVAGGRAGLVMRLDTKCKQPPPRRNILTV